MRLRIRVYLFAMSCAVTVIAIGFLAQAVLGPPYLMPSPPFSAVADVYEHRQDRDAIARITSAIGPSVAVFTVEGKCLTSPAGQAVALGSRDLARLGREPIFALDPAHFVTGHFVAGAPVAYGIFTLTAPRPAQRSLSIAVGVACLVLLSGSLMFAHSIVRPLRRLQLTAQAFGAGELTARTGLAGSDEVSATAVVFDDMAARVERLVRAHRELMANVAHELRTPMARMRMALDLAHEGDDELARSILVEIDRDLVDLQQLVDDVLTSSRLELSQLALHRDPIDIAALVDDVAVRARSWRDGREVILDLATELPGVLGDARLLGRAIENLVANARAYSSPETPIELRGRSRDGVVVLEVVDHGIGIRAQDLAHVFDEFFRGDRSRSRATGGAGLGLALVKKIVEAHGGTIAIESTAGAGTTARIELPAQACAEESVLRGQPVA